MALVLAFQMTNKLKFSVELLPIWHLKLSRKLNIVDLQLMFGHLESYYLQFFLDSFLIEVQPMKLFMIKFQELIVLCNLR